MVWFKVDDRLHSHPKVLQAGDAALGVWVRLGSWASAHETDGVVPAVVARQIGRPALLKRLLDVKLLESHPDGYLLHDFLKYNPSREKIEAERAATAHRVAVWRAARAARRNGVTGAVTHAVSNGIGTPAPSRPVGEGRSLRSLPPLDLSTDDDLGSEVDVTPARGAS